MRTPLRRIATIMKILISYCQMLFVFGALQSVHWPPAFTHFIQAINITLVVGVEAWLSRIFLPLSCATGELSAYTWLSFSLALPIVCSVLIFLLSTAALGAIARSHHRFIGTSAIVALLNGSSISLCSLVCFDGRADAQLHRTQSLK